MRILFLCFILFFAHSTIGFSKTNRPFVKGTKTTPALPDHSIYYSSFEIRHHLNSYYKDQKNLSHKSPSVHLRSQFGSTLYEGHLDLYATIGLYKETETQTFKYRRPQFEVDLYPLKNKSFIIRQYNIFKIGLKNSDHVSNDEEFEDSINDTSYTVGVDARAYYTINEQGSTLQFKIGNNLWSKLYDRPRYIQDELDEDPERDDLALVGEIDTELSQEDYVSRIWNTHNVTMSYRNSYMKKLSTDISAYYRHFFYPEYQSTENHLKYKYIVDRTSYLRLRVKFDLTEHLSFINDFYQFHDSLFQGLKVGSERRYRNITRLSYRM